MKELSIIGIVLQVIAYYPCSLFIFAPFHYRFKSVWFKYGQVVSYWGVWSVCYELIGNLNEEIVCPDNSDDIEKPAYIISAQSFSIIGILLSIAYMVLTIMYVGDVLRNKHIGRILAIVGAGCQLGHGGVLMISVPPMLSGAIADAPAGEPVTVQWSYYMGYADAFLCLASGGLSLVAGLIGDRFGIKKDKAVEEEKKKAAKKQQKKEKVAKQQKKVPGKEHQTKYEEPTEIVDM